MAVVIKTVTIAQSASLSDAVTVPTESSLIGIAMPSAWDTAGLTFQAGTGSPVTYRNMYAADGTEFQAAAIASAHVAIDPQDFVGVGKMKVRSGTSGSAVAQTAARTITLLFDVD